MSQALILVAQNTNPLSANTILETLENFLPKENSVAQSLKWLRPSYALEVSLTHAPERSTVDKLRAFLSTSKTDIFIVPAENRRKKLLLADMDATIVEGETLDDLADTVGLKEQVANITAQAMRGEIDFKEALKKRVALLKGLSSEALETTLRKMSINPGAETVIRVMRRSGAKCYLVSGGFTYFTSAIAQKCGFDGHHGNTLQIADDTLTGEVIPPILDKESKLNFLLEYSKTLEISTDETMAVGDGANDIPMLLKAGIGVGFQPKPLVREKIENIIVHTDLTSLLYIQGYTWQDILAVSS